MKKTMLMYVYGDLNTDARVQRAASILSTEYNIEVIASDKEYQDSRYKTTIISSKIKNTWIKYVCNVLRFINLVSNKSIDVFYAHDYYSAIPALYIKKRNKCKKLIYDAHELSIPTGDTKISIRDKIYYEIEKQLIKTADIMICAQNDRANIMQAHYGLKNIPFVIENISSLSIEGNLPVETENKLHKFLNDNKKTVVYAGVITEKRRILDLIDAVEKNKSTCKLLIVGNGPDKELVKNYMHKKNSLKSLFIDAVPYNTLGIILKKCDIGYLCYPNDTLNNKYCASNKIYEYISVNLPIISNSNDTINNVLRYYNIGCSNDNLSLALNACLDNYDSLKRSCMNINVEEMQKNEMGKLLIFLKENC